MRDCGRDRARIVWFWLRTLADTAQAVPAVHLETVMGPEGRLLKSRLALAVVASLLLLEAERYLLHITLYRLPSTISQLFLAHRPLDPLWR